MTTCDTDVTPHALIETERSSWSTPSNAQLGQIRLAGLAPCGRWREGACCAERVDEGLQAARVDRGVHLPSSSAHSRVRVLVEVDGALGRLVHAMALGLTPATARGWQRERARAEAPAERREEGAGRVAEMLVGAVSPARWSI